MWIVIKNTPTTAQILKDYGFSPVLGNGWLHIAMCTKNIYYLDGVEGVEYVHLKEISKTILDEYYLLMGLGLSEEQIVEELNSCT